MIETLKMLRKERTKLSLVFAAMLAGVIGSSCRGGVDEPGVPSGSAAVATTGIVRVPISGDGSLDTVGIPRISFGESRYEFGAVDEGMVVTRRFTFRNAGKRPLIITHASSTCGCTVPAWPREPIPPGDTASVGVRFDTRGKTGPQLKVITLTANTYPNTTQLQLVGTVDAAE